MLRGIVGHVKWHYYTAAAINGYTVTRIEGGGLLLTATVVMKDAFKIAQRPLIFEAPHAKGVWRWPLITHTLTESGHLTARLGAEILTSYNGEPPGDLCHDFSNQK